MRKIIIVLLIISLLLLTEVENKKKGKTQKHNKSKKKKQHTSQQYHPHYLTSDQPQFWYNSLLATFLALAGGFCSGMTIGLNSLSVLRLQVMSKSSDPAAKQMGNRLLKVVSDHHLLLVTLLVGNAIVLESLPLVIHLIMPDWAAILFSTVVVLIVAQVVPMSCSTGPQKYIIAYYCAPLVSLMIFCFWPICYPIARGLDRLLGSSHEQRIYRRDFLTIINDRHKNQLQDLMIDFINQVMNHADRTLKEFMTPFQEIYMLQQKEPINNTIIDKISHLSFSFILIYRKDRQNVIGYVKTKQIIIKYLRIKGHSNNIYIDQLIKHKITQNIVTVYNDAIAIQALEIIENFKTRVMLVTDQLKHTGQQYQDQLSSVKVYYPQEWIVKQPCKIIGIVTLNQVLYEVADYPIEAMNQSQRKIGHRDTKEKRS